ADHQDVVDLDVALAAHVEHGGGRGMVRHADAAAQGRVDLDGVRTDHPLANAGTEHAHAGHGAGHHVATVIAMDAVAPVGPPVVAAGGHLVDHRRRCRAGVAAGLADVARHQLEAHADAFLDSVDR